MKKHLLLLLFTFIRTFAFSLSRITGVVVGETGSLLPEVSVVAAISTVTTKELVQSPAFKSSDVFSAFWERKG